MCLYSYSIFVQHINVWNNFTCHGLHQLLYTIFCLSVLHGCKLRTDGFSLKGERFSIGFNQKQRILNTPYSKLPLQSIILHTFFSNTVLLYFSLLTSIIGCCNEWRKVFRNFRLSIFMYLTRNIMNFFSPTVIIAIHFFNTQTNYLTHNKTRSLFTTTLIYTWGCPLSSNLSFPPIVNSCSTSLKRTIF